MGLFANQHELFSSNSLPTLIPEKNSNWQLNRKSNTTKIEYELLFFANFDSREELKMTDK